VCKYIIGCVDLDNETNLCQNITHFMAFEDLQIISGNHYDLVGVNVFLNMNIIYILMKYHVLFTQKRN